MILSERLSADDKTEQALRKIFGRSYDKLAPKQTKEQVLAHDIIKMLPSKYEFGYEYSELDGERVMLYSLLDVADIYDEIDLEKQSLPEAGLTAGYAIRKDDELAKIADELCSDSITQMGFKPILKEGVIEHYSNDPYPFDQTRFYTYFKVLDEERNTVYFERYLYTPKFLINACPPPMNRMDIEAFDMQPWEMQAYGTYRIGHTVDSYKSAIRNALKLKKTTINTMYTSGLSLKVATRELCFPFDYVQMLYVWRKIKENREIRIKEVTKKEHITNDKAPKKKKNPVLDAGRRVVTIGDAVYVYTHSDKVVTNIKKRNHEWHVDSFYRSGCQCLRHNKDGTTTSYYRNGCTVNPKSVSKRKTTYVMK